MSETTTSQPAEQDAERAVKAKHRAVWASGDYPAVAADLIPGLGARLVRACGIRPASVFSTSPQAPVMPRSRPPRRGPR